MTDTAIQVSTEDANMLAAVFRRAADAIIQASTLPSEIEALHARVSALQVELDNAHVHASELDNTLSELRQQRDEARGERDTALSDLRAVRLDLDREKHESELWRSSHARVNSELSEAKHAHDDAEYRAMELTERLEKSEAKMKDLKEHFKGLFNLHEEPTPEPASPPADIVEEPTASDWPEWPSIRQVS